MATVIWAWVGFAAFILLMLALDLGVLNRKARVATMPQSVFLCLVWLALALTFAAGVFRLSGRQSGLEFLTAYLIELSLSVDNLFVFILIFSFFRVPVEYQHRVLFWGVLSALVMRVGMIFIGTSLIRVFHPITYIFGAFLVYAGMKMLWSDETKADFEKGLGMRVISRLVPVTRSYEGERFFTRKDGVIHGTLLLLVLGIIEVSDLVFAADSIPAVLAVSGKRFVLFTSNAFAVLGLRSVYFLLASVVGKLRFLSVGLAAVLVFVGVKMLAQSVIQIPVGLALGILGLILGSSVVLSLIWSKTKDQPAG